MKRPKPRRGKALITHQSRPLRIMLVGDPDDLLEAASSIIAIFGDLHGNGIQADTIDYQPDAGDTWLVLTLDMPNKAGKG